MTSLEERAVFAKLEALKDIRNKTLQLEKLKSRILKEVEATEQEEKCLLEYKQEMELLLQEKMSHVEELRQIHADINAMEGVIKHAEDNRARSLQSANRIHEEYLPLKTEIDRLRMECLGLDKLPDLHEEEGSIISSDRFATHYYTATKLHTAPTFGSKASDWARPLVSSDVPMGSLGASLSHSFLAQPSPLRLVTKQPDSTRPPTSLGLANPGPPTPTFRSDFVSLRQQPPPMKSCLSCHQQIHRNAPICPLCKAKSRSRNPKKPKKKDN